MSNKMRPDMPQGSPNPNEEARLGGGPDAQRNPLSQKSGSQKSPDRPKEAVVEQAKNRMNNGPTKDEI